MGWTTHNVSTGDPTYGEAKCALMDREQHIEPYEGTILSHVYFLLDRVTCEIKIGYSTNLEQRVRDLCRERGRNLELLGSIRAGRHVEKMFHRRFAPYRRQGEWFSSEIIGELAPLLEAT